MKVSPIVPIVRLEQLFPKLLKNRAVIAIEIQKNWLFMPILNILSSSILMHPSNHDPEKICLIYKKKGERSHNRSIGLNENPSVAYL